MKTCFTFPIDSNHNLHIEQNNEGIAIIVEGFGQKQQIDIHKTYYDIFMNYLKALDLTIEERKHMNWFYTRVQSDNDQNNIGFSINPSKEEYYTINFYSIEHGSVVTVLKPQTFYAVQKILKNICQK